MTYSVGPSSDNIGLIQSELPQEEANELNVTFRVLHSFAENGIFCNVLSIAPENEAEWSTIRSCIEKVNRDLHGWTISITEEDGGALIQIHQNSGSNGN